MRRWILNGVTMLILAYAASYVLLCSRLLRLGSTPDEASRTLPGDEVVPDAVQSTRAITIGAPAREIWPWLTQIGQDRGGFYSYDLLERLSGAQIHNADRVHPEWQDLEVGDLVRTYRRVPRFEPLGWFVVRVEPERALVVRNKTTTWSWALVLEPVDAVTTRFILRTRSLRRRGPLAKVDLLTGEPAHLVMEIGVLRGVKHRAERAAPQAQASDTESGPPAPNEDEMTLPARRRLGVGMST